MFARLSLNFTGIILLVQGTNSIHPIQTCYRSASRIPAM